MSSIDVLGIFAHPDDLELLVGGTMLKMKSLGHRTGTIDITRGEMGTRGTVETRYDESVVAAKILNLNVRENLQLQDGRVYVGDKDDARTQLVRVLRRLKPRVIFTHQLDDPHPDHDGTARLVRDAARLSSMKNYDPETGDEKIAVPMIAHNIFSQRVLPSFIIDVSDFLEKKLLAIRAYQSQFHNPASTEPATRLSAPGFLEEVEARSRYYGSLIGVAAGEPFWVREALNVNDPVELLSRPMNLYS